ncbi:hypothetical protein BP6252_13787 [Coleophoma cylindrospora]|uniref:Transcription factor domain-containing protein n=1 Tax=Coleophoma cylindrospora TaxID=1849047 RepID=A0A3D8Q6N4_9HELO|nr:hypothetical protein BP6252_13787 [Coleophoma cylindrospora]
MRCIKANRTCGGYESAAVFVFRPYEAPGTNISSKFLSQARKCSMPTRAPIPGTDVLSEDILPAEISQAQSNELALRAFFYDYCIVSTNPNLSRGFLSGLEMMAHRLGPQSDLAKACQAVAFGSHGKPLNRPQLVAKAEMFHQELLGSLAEAIENPASANATEAKLVAMLLGLYQIIVATESNPGNHVSHAKGLAALMGSGHSPLSLLSTRQSAYVMSPKTRSQVSGIFSVPALSCQKDSLDDLLLSLDQVWRKFEASLELKGLNSLNEEAIQLERRFSRWQDSRNTEFKPTIIGHVSKGRSGSETAAGYWPGRVDTYFDLYVAGVWNIFRAARLLLIVLIVNLPNTTGDTDSHIRTANCIVEDMIASIPYHLTDNLPAFLSELATSIEITDPGRSVGGLLLMHPLYVASKMPFLPEKVRKYMLTCLSWIGSNMGLGQAGVLATVSGVIIYQFIS